MTLQDKGGYEYLANKANGCWSCDKQNLSSPAVLVGHFLNLENWFRRAAFHLPFFPVHMPPMCKAKVSSMCVCVGGTAFVIWGIYLLQRELCQYADYGCCVHLSTPLEACSCLPDEGVPLPCTVAIMELLQFLSGKGNKAMKHNTLSIFINLLAVIHYRITVSHN